MVLRIVQIRKGLGSIIVIGTREALNIYHMRKFINSLLLHDVIIGVDCSMNFARHRQRKEESCGCITKR